MHHFPYRIADIDHLTARLTPEEFGALVRLWMAYLKAEKGPAADEGNLGFLTGARSASERRALAAVIKRFFTVNGETQTLESVFCEDLIGDYRANGVQSRYANLCRHWEKANKGVPKPSFEQFAINPDAWFDGDTGRVRKVTDRNPLVLTAESEDSPNLPPPACQPKTSTQEPITNGTPVVPKGTITSGHPDWEKCAEAVYAIYPKKAGKGKAIAAIVKVLKSGKITELELQGRVRAYAQAVAQWDEPDKTYIPFPATWFNQTRYEDDPATWIREPAGDAKKKKGGGASNEPTTLFAMGTAAAQEAPVGWETAMTALFGEGWREFYAAFETMPPADQRQVWAWLEKNNGAAAQ